MKKLLLATAIFLTSTTAYGWGLSWESVSSWGRENIEPITYNVESSGNNLRIYEWITPTSPYQKCIFVASERNTNLQCVDVNIEDVEPRSMVNEENQ